MILLCDRMRQHMCRCLALYKHMPDFSGEEEEFCREWVRGLWAILAQIQVS